MICSQYPPVYGGAGQQAQLLGEALAKRGWTVDVITLDQDALGSGLEGNIRVVRLLKGLAGGQPWTRAVTSLALGFYSASLVVLRRPTAVHVHGAYWWSIPPLIAAKLMGARAVVKVTRDGEDDPATVMTRKFAGFPVGWLYGASFRVADHVVTLSKQTYEAAVERLPKPEKVQLVRNGVDVLALERTAERRKTARDSFDLGDDVKVTTFVGYLVEHKGVLDLLSAWQERGKHENEQLWLVGPYDGFYRELTAKVRTQIEILQSSGFNIRLFGKVARSDMPSIYWATDVFTLPSYAEGMPNSLAEAMVAGCRVVATEIPGIVDIIDPKTAELVAPGDVTALVKALNSSRRSGNDSEARAAENLGIMRTARSIENLYAPSH